MRILEGFLGFVVIFGCWEVSDLIFRLLLRFAALLRHLGLNKIAGKGKKRLCLNRSLILNIKLLVSGKRVCLLSKLSPLTLPSSPNVIVPILNEIL